MVLRGEVFRGLMSRVDGHRARRRRAAPADQHPRPAQPAQRRGRLHRRRSTGSARTRPGCSTGCSGSPAPAAGSSPRGRPPGSPSSTTTPTTPARSPRSSAPAPSSWPASGRLVVVFQPHLYSRTRDFAREFAAALRPGRRRRPHGGLRRARGPDARGLLRSSSPTPCASCVPDADVAVIPSWSAVAEHVAGAGPRGRPRPHRGCRGRDDDRARDPARPRPGDEPAPRLLGRGRRRAPASRRPGPGSSAAPHEVRQPPPATGRVCRGDPRRPRRCSGGWSASARCWRSAPSRSWASRRPRWRAIRALAQVPLGEPLARVDGDAVAARVAERATVADVSIERSWPSTLVIHASPRQPFLVVKNPQGQLQVVDETGVAYAQVSAAPQRGADGQRGQPGGAVPRRPGGGRQRREGAAARPCRSGSPTSPSAAPTWSPCRIGRTSVVWGGVDEPERKLAIMTALLKGSPKLDRRQRSEHPRHPLTRAGLGAGRRRRPSTCGWGCVGLDVTGVTTASEPRSDETCEIG